MTEVKKKIQEILDNHINNYGEIGVDGENEEAMISDILSLIQEERLEAMKEKSMQKEQKARQEVTTIADTTDLSEYWAERQRIAYDKQEDRITRVAIILQEFLKLANSKEYWDGERSGRGWVRMWARKIVETM